MGGSRKGERRGGAKPGHVRKSAAPPAPPSPIAQAKRKGGRPKGSKNKPKDQKAVVDLPYIVKLINARRGPIRREHDMEMYYTIVGKRLRTPKEVLLDAMRYFENSAVEYAGVLEANLAAAAEAKTIEERTVLGAAIEAAEAQVDKYVSMAADVAFKGAPYFHPRLAAVMTGGDSKDNQTLLQLLMRDLDEAGKPARYIDHDASEIAK